MMPTTSDRFPLPLPFPPALPRRTILIAVAALLLFALLPATTVANQQPGRYAKPTIVLVHGAWADPDGWEQVANQLHRDGFTTVAPKLGLMSVDGDVAIVRAALDGIRGKKILVAHSYGGFVISNAARGRSDILSLVYTAAFVPDQGDSILSLGNGFVESEAIHHLSFTGTPWASPAYIDRAWFHEIFAADLSRWQAAAMNAAQQPASLALLVTPSGPGAWHTLPSYYAVSGKDLIIDPAQQRWMAARAGATIIEFKKGSHVGGYTVHATQFTNLIKRAVRETAR